MLVMLSFVAATVLIAFTEEQVLQLLPPAQPLK
jgi:hypothetical protein